MFINLFVEKQAAVKQLLSCEIIRRCRSKACPLAGGAVFVYAEPAPRPQNREKHRKNGENFSECQKANKVRCIEKYACHFYKNNVQTHIHTKPFLNV